MNNKKIKMIIGCLISILIIVCVFFFLSKFQSNEIVFKDDMKEIEYGTKVEYQDLIKQLEDKNARVTYPEGEIKEVGTYHVTYVYELDGDKKKIEHTFEVVDTSIPEMELFIEDKTVEVAINKTEYNVLSNIKKFNNLSEEAMANKVLLSSKDYEKMIGQLEDARENINSQIVTEKLAKSELTRNAVIYTSDLDLTKEGTYSIKVKAIDENYNESEEKTWKIKVVQGGKLLNSGGNVECDFSGDSLDEEAYTTTIKELYTYNPLKLVGKYELITTMSFKEDYGTVQNKDALSSAIESKYAAMREETGVAITIHADKSQVVTIITVDFLQYDLTKDVLNILVKKDGSYVKIESIVENAEQNKFICKIL